MVGSKINNHNFFLFVRNVAREGKVFV